jgi:hypothetical protein
MPRSAPSPSRFPHTDAVVIRRAYPDDAATLARLAALDSRRQLTGPVIVAERDGAVLAARSLEDGRTIANPFASTADLVALLSVRAVETARTGRRRELLRRASANTRRHLALARG